MLHGISWRKMFSKWSPGTHSEGSQELFRGSARSKLFPQHWDIISLFSLILSHPVGFQGPFDLRQSRGRYENQAAQCQLAKGFVKLQKQCQLLIFLVFGKWLFFLKLCYSYQCIIICFKWINLFLISALLLNMVRIKSCYPPKERKLSGVPCNFKSVKGTKTEESADHRLPLRVNWNVGLCHCHHCRPARHTGEAMTSLTQGTEGCTFLLGRGRYWAFIRVSQVSVTWPTPAEVGATWRWTQPGSWKAWGCRPDESVCGEKAEAGGRSTCVSLRSEPCRSYGEIRWMVCVKFLGDKII